MYGARGCVHALHDRDAEILRDCAYVLRQNHAYDRVRAYANDSACPLHENPLPKSHQNRRHPALILKPC